MKDVSIGQGFEETFLWVIRFVLKLPELGKETEKVMEDWNSG